MVTDLEIKSVQLTQPRCAIFEFRTDALTSQQITGIFWNGVDGNYTIGADRLIQRYLEVYEYEVVFSLVIDPTYANRPFRFIKAACRDCVEGMRSAIETQLQQGIGSVLTGYVMIDAGGIHNYLRNRLSATGLSKQKAFSIKDADLLWKPLSPDMRAVIQTWMRKEVFSPQRPAPWRDRTGSRLNMADLVTTGVIYALLRRGALRSDFAETYSARGRPEVI